MQNKFSLPQILGVHTVDNQKELQTNLFIDSLFNMLGILFNGQFSSVNRELKF